MELKTIPQDAELIIFDFCNTLVIESDGNLKLRDDAFDLIARLKLKGKKMAISSTTSLEDITSCAGILAIRPFVDRIYGEEHIIIEEGRKYKDLSRICKDFEVEPKKAVFIGDNYGGIDKMSSERYSVNFIHVPSQERNPDYNLKELIEK